LGAQATSRTQSVCASKVSSNTHVALGFDREAVLPSNAGVEKLPEGEAVVFVLRVQILRVLSDPAVMKRWIGVGYAAPV
jgi:hypothetical protein